jgi:hypothetical protein
MRSGRRVRPGLFRPFRRMRTGAWGVVVSAPPAAVLWGERPPLLWPPCIFFLVRVWVILPLGVPRVRARWVCECAVLCCVEKGRAGLEEGIRELIVFCLWPRVRPTCARPTALSRPPRPHGPCRTPAPPLPARVRRRPPDCALGKQQRRRQRLPSFFHPPPRGPALPWRLPAALSAGSQAHPFARPHVGNSSSRLARARPAARHRLLLSCRRQAHRLPPSLLAHPLHPHLPWTSLPLLRRPCCRPFGGWLMGVCEGRW